MEGFRFHLERILDWRRTERDAEEAKLQKLTLAWEEAESAVAQAKATRTVIEMEARALESLSGRDLAALSALRVRLQVRERYLQLEVGACEKRLATQRQVWVDARRRCRLLEELKSRRLAEFEYEMERDLENLATETYLATWSQASARER